MSTSKYWVLKIWIISQLFCKINCEYARVTSYDLMKCSYGERGSLTATCVNATPNFFKSTLYKFDHLDETLRCVNCTLTTIESNAFDLSGNQIAELDLRNSLIEVLKPKAFMGLIFLKTLNLANNKIRSIFPGTFSGTKKIVTLDISNNEISILSESGFAELMELQNLKLRQNQIKVVDTRAFNGLNKLTQLDLSFNLISSIKNSLENTTALESLNLRHNSIEQFSGEEFFNLVHLNEIDVSENAFDDQFRMTMQPGNQLRKISLAHNKFTRVSFQVSHLEALEDLDLKFNNISIINNTSFEHMYNLHTLDLAYNKLEEIRTGQFSGLPQLRSLNCSNNKIKEILITGVFSLQNLHSLDLSHNQVSDLDYTALISRVPSLSYLRLEDNTLPCQLEQEMEETFADDSFKYVLYDNVVGSPKCDENRPVVKSKLKNVHDVYVKKSQADESMCASDVVMFILISLMITAIGILFYLQYLFYKGVQLTGPKRVASTVQLISSENDQKEDEFEHVRT